MAAAAPVVNSSVMPLRLCPKLSLLVRCRLAGGTTPPSSLRRCPLCIAGAPAPFAPAPCSTVLEACPCGVLFALSRHCSALIAPCGSLPLSTPLQCARSEPVSVAAPACLAPAQFAPAHSSVVLEACPCRAPVALLPHGSALVISHWSPHAAARSASMPAAAGHCAPAHFAPAHCASAAQAAGVAACTSSRPVPSCCAAQAVPRDPVTPPGTSPRLPSSLPPAIAPAHCAPTTSCLVESGPLIAPRTECSRRPRKAEDDLRTLASLTLDPFAASPSPSGQREAAIAGTCAGVRFNLAWLRTHWKQFPATGPGRQA